MTTQDPPDDKRHGCLTDYGTDLCDIGDGLEALKNWLYGKAPVAREAETIACLMRQVYIECLQSRVDEVMQ